VSDATAITMLYVLVGLAAAWLLLLGAVWFRLIGQHGATYSEMLKSSAVSLFGMPGPWITLKFIALRRHRALGDPGLSFLSDASLLVLVSYVAIFLTLAVSTKGS
jgi:hypothetical protein